ncbi:hypothetical protein ES703_73821 [subsurface metagenome]
MKELFKYKKGTKRYYYSKLLLRDWLSLEDLNKKVRKKFGFASIQTLRFVFDELRKKGVKLRRGVFYRLRKGW